MPNGYTPKYTANDVSAVATDIAVGTGAETFKYRGLIALGLVTRRLTKKRRKGNPHCKIHLLKLLGFKKC